MLRSTNYFLSPRDWSNTISQTADPSPTTDRAQSSVFLSYSRDNITFVERLHTALEERGINAHLDREDIEKGEDWWQRLAQLITDSDSIVFVLSPASAASDVCAKEVAHAASLNKRFIPVVIDDLSGTTPPPELQRLNYIFFVEDARAGASGDFDEALDQLVHALDTDIGWVREHTRLGAIAQRWDSRARGLEALLRGADLEAAEQWLSQQPANAPVPTPATARLITQSRQAATRRQRQWIGGSLGIALVSITLAAFSLIQWNRAEAEARTALSRQLATQAQAQVDTKFDEALLLSVAAFELEQNTQTLGALLATSSAIPQTLAILGDPQSVVTLAASPVGSVFALGSVDGTVTLWDAIKKQTSASLPAASGNTPSSVTAMAFNDSGAQMVVAYDNGLLRLWDIASDAAQTLRPEGAEVLGVAKTLALSPAGQFLAEAGVGPDGYSEFVQLWNITNMTAPLWHLPSDVVIHVEHLSFANERQLNLVDWGKLQTLSVDTGQSQKTLNLGKFANPGPSAYDNTGHIGASSGFDTGGFFVFETATARELSEGQVAPAPIDAMSLSSDGAGLAIAQGRRVSVFDSDGLRTGDFATGAQAVTDIAFAQNPDIFAALSAAGRVHIFDLKAQNRLSETLRTPEYVPRVIQGVMAAAFSMDGSHLAWVGRQNEAWVLWVHDTTTDALMSYPLTSEPMYRLNFTDDARLRVFGADGMEGVLDVTTGTWTADTACDGAAMTNTWSPPAEDPSLVFSRCGPDGVETMDLTARFDALVGGVVTASALNDTGARLAVAIQDNALVLVDLADDSAIRFDLHEVFGAGQIGMLKLLLSADGTRIAIGEYGGAMGLYSVADMQSSGQFRSGAYDELRAFSDFVFGPGGTKLAVDRGNAQIGLWDTQEAQLIAEFTGDLDQAVRSLIFSASEDRLAEVLPGGGLTLWTIEPQRWHAAACKLAGRSLSDRERARSLPDTRYADRLSICNGPFLP